MYQELVREFKDATMDVTSPLTHTLDANKEYVDRTLKNIKDWGEDKCWHIRNEWNRLLDRVPILESFYTSKTYDNKTPYQRLQYIRGRKIRVSRNVDEGTVMELRRYRFRHDIFVRPRLTWFGPRLSPVKYVSQLVEAHDAICQSILTGVTVVS